MKKLILLLLLLTAGILFATKPRFIDLGNGTVLDNKTNLLWQQCPKGASGKNCKDGSIEKAKWEDAKAYCENLTLNNKTWRLPQVNELLSLVYIKDTKAINSNFFPKFRVEEGGSIVWSNTPIATISGNFFIVNLHFAASGFEGIENTNTVFCVTTP